MKIEKLQYFIDLYENGSYTKTAKKNFISQTSVTQFINSLENEFNVKLFDRSKLPIIPTAAGKRFYLEAQTLLHQYYHMKKVMQECPYNFSIPLKLCYTSRIDLHLLLPFIPDFKKTYPEINVEISKVSMKNAAEHLSSGKCDLVIGIDFNFNENESCKTIVLYQGQYNALVSSNHDLYQHNSITNEELYHYPLIMLSPDVIGDSYNAMVNRSKQDGYYPNIVKTVDDVETEFFTIISDNLIGFAPDNYPLNELTGAIKKIPIENSHHDFELILGYRIDSNPATKIFVKELSNYSKNE